MSHVVNMGTGTIGSHTVIEQILDLSNLTMADIEYTVVTGYGRMQYKQADKQITEISCHARGVHYLFPDAKYTIDIGGQDAKLIKTGKNGRVDNFVMNDKCAAGTGRFFEVMSRVLGCGINRLSDLAESDVSAVVISSVCTVFAESEVISQLSSGASIESVAKGVYISVAKRVSGLCNRIGIGEGIVMTGGVALQKSMVNSLRDELGKEIQVPQEPQIIGALGAALYAYSKCKN